MSLQAAALGLWRRSNLHIDGGASVGRKAHLPWRTAPGVYPRKDMIQRRWTDFHPPETFSFSRCTVFYKGGEYEGWVYYPHPAETKKTHFQNPSLIEVIAHPISEIQYGDELEIEIDTNEIFIIPHTA